MPSIRAPRIVKLHPSEMTMNMLSSSSSSSLSLLMSLRRRSRASLSAHPSLDFVERQRQRALLRGKILNSKNNTRHWSYLLDYLLDC